MRLTVPQIIMLNHASWVNRERAEAKYDQKKAEEEKQEEIPTYNGKPISEMNSKEMALYYGSFFTGEE